MILSVSRRTDIPHYYWDWFIQRMKEGFLYVRNPVNYHQVSKILLTPETVDGFVFWSKYPVMAARALDAVKDYPYYIQFTITGYGTEAEPGLPSKEKEILPLFRGLADKLGRERLIWRYDPIFFSNTYTPEYHIRQFGRMASYLDGYTDRVVVSFMDFYEKTLRNTGGLGILPFERDACYALLEELAQIAAAHHMELYTCAEKLDFHDARLRQVRPGSCIDRQLFERLTGMTVCGKKDRNQRAECGCIESIDIGAYDTCPTGCRYCYANVSCKRNTAPAGETGAVHEALLSGHIGPEDQITQRRMSSVLDNQYRLF
ncbi:DUF1848 domain-containing protein [Anaerolentibacter hominis]|uniref:DUF1848 domain-containing protein n=1 Tax=Anaerolentibacter hominis TaxID=3079009 RepID=UPI0031B86759